MLVVDVVICDGLLALLVCHIIELLPHPVVGVRLTCCQTKRRVVTVGVLLRCRVRVFCDKCVALIAADRVKQTFDEISNNKNIFEMKIVNN